MTDVRDQRRSVWLLYYSYDPWDRPFGLRGVFGEEAEAEAAGLKMLQPSHDNRCKLVEVPVGAFWDNSFEPLTTREMMP